VNTSSSSSGPKGQGHRPLLAATAVAVAMVALAIAGGFASTAAQEKPQTPHYTQLMLVTGDSLEVRFTTPFCSGNLKKDQVLDAEVASDKVISGCIAVREGTPVKVRVVDASGNGFAGKAGKLSLLFESTLAADGASVSLQKSGPLSMKGKGKGIILKVLTLFIIHGSEPCVGTQDRFFPQIDQTTQVLVDPASCK
jgi:hypothetical protein